MPLDSAAAVAAAADRRVGLIAAWGEYPVVVAESLRARGREVYCLGVRGHADRARLAPLCRRYNEMGLGRLGSGIRFFQRHGVSRATMAGKVFKTLLFRRGGWVRHLPDWTTFRTFFSHYYGKKDRTDDSLLGTVVQAFAQGGITLVPATDFIPEILVKEGLLTGSLNRAIEADIEFGWRLAKEMGRLDIGQSVAVKGKAVLAVEAVEGTDECIRRAGELCQAGGFVVVKVAKPQQDMRFDVPTIGEGTIRSMALAGARVLAVEAERTILLHEQATLALARRHGITVVALSAAGEGREHRAA